MDRISQIFTLHRALRNARAPVRRERLSELLEDCSASTLTRVIREMRDLFQAPIEYDREHCGYRYSQGPSGDNFELPGLWFNASELYALLSCQQLLTGMQPGLLDEHVAPLKSRIDQIFRAQKIKPADLGQRVRILAMAQRAPAASIFKPLASALLQRRQVRIEYHGRARDVTTERLLSPQRLVHYRDNWYLDAWDHEKREVRTFSVDRVRSAIAVNQPAKEIAETELNRQLGGSYGIFSGVAAHTAILRFTAERARWVADEQWHPAQQSQWLADGKFELRIPYSGAQELVMDILRYGPDVEVVGPPTLRQQVAERLAAGAGVYQQHL
jgi:proteasome accessory factor C